MRRGSAWLGLIVIAVFLGHVHRSAVATPPSGVVNLPPPDGAPLFAAGLSTHGARIAWHFFGVQWLGTALDAVDFFGAVKSKSIQSGAQSPHAIKGSHNPGRLLSDLSGICVLNSRLAAPAAKVIGSSLSLAPSSA
jgi:hypothetical protein